MNLDPKKYRFRSTLTGKLVLQKSIEKSYATCDVDDDPNVVLCWYDAKVTDLNLLISKQETK